SISEEAQAFFLKNFEEGTAPSSSSSAVPIEYSQASDGESDDDEKPLDSGSFRASLTLEKAKHIVPDITPNASGRAQIRKDEDGLVRDRARKLNESGPVVAEPLTLPNIASGVAPVLSPGGYPISEEAQAVLLENIEDDAVPSSSSPAVPTEYSQGSDGDKAKHIVSDISPNVSRSQAAAAAKTGKARIGLKLSNTGATYRFTGLQGLTPDQRHAIFTAFPSSYDKDNHADGVNVLLVLQKAGVKLSDTARTYLLDYRKAREALLLQINSASGDDVASGGERFVYGVGVREGVVNSLPTAAGVVVASTVSPVIAPVDNIILGDTRRTIFVGTVGSGDRLRFNLRSLGLDDHHAFREALVAANPLRVLSDAGFKLTNKAQKLLKKRMPAQGSASNSDALGFFTPMQPQAGAAVVLSQLGVSETEGLSLAHELFDIQPTGGEMTRPSAGVRFSKAQYAALGALFNYLKMEQERAVREKALVKIGQAPVVGLPPIRLVATDGGTYTLRGVTPQGTEFLQNALRDFGLLEEQSRQAALGGYKGQGPTVVQLPLALEDGSSSVHSSAFYDRHPTIVSATALASGRTSVPRPIAGTFREFIYPQMAPEEQATVRDHAPHLLAVDSQESDEDVSTVEPTQPDVATSMPTEQKGPWAGSTIDAKSRRHMFENPLRNQPKKTLVAAEKPVQSDSPTNVTASVLDGVVAGGDKPNGTTADNVDVAAANNNVVNKANASSNAIPALANGATSTPELEKKDYSKWEVGGGAAGFALAAALFKSVSPEERGAVFSRLKSGINSNRSLTSKQKWAAVRMLSAAAAAAVATVAAGHGLYAMATKKNEVVAGN
ncbi:MAG: hypothetical protein QG632_587, partial [Candidatus Dependentiae bacterium]|nr:hypothetical protein [Candidatus Dependentiae bacterium]